LGGLLLDATLLTLQLEGVSPRVPSNQFERKRTKNNYLKTVPNIKHKRSPTNENVTHVKSTKHET
jgi:hypothetical protein